MFEIKDVSGNIERLLYDGDALVAEYNASGAMLDRYVHGPGAGDDPLIWHTGPTTYRWTANYLYADRQGSIVEAANFYGNPTAINSYDEYGVPGPSTGIENLGRFRYTGQTWIPELGQYYYKARMYSPGLGRFMQTDPIGYADGMNMYRYVGNDPVNFVDPTGLQAGSGCQSRTTKWIHFYDYDENGRPDPGEGAWRTETTVTLCLPVIDESLFGLYKGQNIIVLSGASGDSKEERRCGSGPRIKISPFGFGVTGFLFVGGASLGVEGGISVPLTALEGNFRGTQLYGTASATGLVGLGAFVGGGSNYAIGYSPGPVETGTSVAPVVQAGAAWKGGGEFQVEISPSPGVGGGTGPRSGYGAYVAAGVKGSATAATPELCY